MILRLWLLVFAKNVTMTVYTTIDSFFLGRGGRDQYLGGGGGAERSKLMSKSFG